MEKFLKHGLYRDEEQLVAYLNLERVVLKWLDSVLENIALVQYDLKAPKSEKTTPKPLDTTLGDSDADMAFNLESVESWNNTIWDKYMVITESVVIYEDEQPLKQPIIRHEWWWKWSSSFERDEEEKTGMSISAKGCEERKSDEGDNKNEDENTEEM
ncbi:hypothetical protein Bca101_018408 [Brassica carinata]